MDRDEKIARAIYQALKRAGRRNALVQPPIPGETSVIDGEFDYRAIASALEASLRKAGLVIYSTDIAE